MPGTITLLYAVASTCFETYGAQIDLRLNVLTISHVLYCGNKRYCHNSYDKHDDKKNFLLEKIGKYSLALFALHPTIFFFTSQFLLFFASESTVGEMRATYLSLRYSIFSIIVILASVKIINMIKPTRQNLF